MPLLRLRLGLVGVVAVAAASLVACQRQPERAALDIESVRAMLLTGVDEAPPPRRPGLWRETVAPEGRDKRMTMVFEICTDAALEVLLTPFAAASPRWPCESIQSRLQPDGRYAFSMACGKPPQLGILEGDLQSAYTVRYADEGQVGGGPPLMMQLRSERLGDCPRRTAPGHVTLALLGAEPSTISSSREQLVGRGSKVQSGIEERPY